MAGGYHLGAAGIELFHDYRELYWILLIWKNEADGEKKGETENKQQQQQQKLSTCRKTNPCAGKEK